MVVEGGDSCGISGTGETPQELAPRRLNARPTERVRLKRKSTVSFSYKKRTAPSLSLLAISYFFQSHQKENQQYAMPSFLFQVLLVESLLASALNILDLMLR